MSLGAWIPVTDGLSGARVLRSPDGTAYAKTAPTPDVLVELERERDVLLWLERSPAWTLLAPRVLDWVDGRTLVTQALPGVPLSAVGPGAAAGAALAAALIALDALAVAECPFSRRLAEAMPQARARVAAGLVDADDFDDERRGLSPDDVLALLEGGLERATALEAGSLAVCHGDLCPPNVHVDPVDGRLVGLLDVGRLGVADRHLDLALADRSLAEADPETDADAVPSGPVVVATGREVDPWRVEYYRTLDELF